MQMQVENAKSNIQSIVPFRQCKLTEILFSDSLSSNHRSRRKDVMIVTADPLGDYNATSQILKYSALAKKIENPRVTSTAQSIGLAPGSRNGPSGRTTPSAIMEDLEAALEQITSLRDELEITQLQLQEETNRRLEAEALWASSETRIDEMLQAREEEVRAEVYDEMEKQMMLEKRKRAAARDEEMDRQDDYVDRKLEIMARGITIYEDQENIEPQPEVEDAAVDRLAQRIGSMALRGTGRKVFEKEKENPRLSELEDENARLRVQLANAEREKGLRSPSKKVRVLKTRKWEGDGMSLSDDL